MAKHIERSLLDPLGLFSILYQAIQLLISFVFSPPIPAKTAARKPLGQVAVIGSGWTGISSAAHLVGHGFEVTIFESSDKLGGIWSKTNETSGLQISSLMYRPHPAVVWSQFFPKTPEILEQIEKVAQRYGLMEKIRFNTPVTLVERHSSSTDPKEGGHARWIINGDTNRVYDGLVVAIGTCGKAKMFKLPGQEKFKGKIVHSSQLDGVELKGKKVLCVGAGASGVEAAELAMAKSAESVTILARSDKWFIPRLTIVDVLLSLQPLGRETWLSWIPETLIKLLHYRGLSEKMAPTQGFYTGTPIVNSSVLYAIRRGECDYLRGDVLELDSKGVEFNFRKRGQKKGSKGKQMHLDADLIIVSGGFERPTMEMLPQDLFPEDYKGHNSYLQVFPVTDCSIVCTNSTFKDAVGTVAHIHIGIYARTLVLFLLEPKTRPRPRDMRLWVDLIRWFKESAPGGALSFMTYMELTIWLISFLFLRIQRTQFFFFVLFGFGFWIPTGEGEQPQFYLSLTKMIPFFATFAEKRAQKQRNKDINTSRADGVKTD